MNLPIAIQLYTLREETKKDFVAVLEKVADMGYQGVEFAGFGDLEATEMKSHLDRLGLKAVGSHTPIEMLENEMDQLIDYNLTIGNKYICVPYAEYSSKEDFLKMAEKLNKWGVMLKEQGLELLYHNHDQEFESFAGKYGLDLIYSNVPSDILKVELDTYWVKKAGLNPASYLSKYAERTPLVHLKDMDAETGVFAEVGEGIIDIEDIIKEAEKGVAEWLIVEQDVCQRPALESAEISIRNLKEL